MGIIRRLREQMLLRDEMGEEPGGLHICFDTETTGLRAGEDEILTVSVVDFDGNVLFDGGFKPSRKESWPNASRINGIYPEDVEGLPAIGSAVPELAGIFGTADVVCGYNVKFDLGFMRAIGISPREDAVITDAMHGFSDAYAMENGSAPRRHKLTEAAEHIGYRWTGKAHGSLADALATVAVAKWAAGVLEREGGAWSCDGFVI